MCEFGVPVTMSKIYHQTHGLIDVLLGFLPDSF